MESPTRQTVAITGASGLIGSALATSLQADGHRVIALVRRPPRGPDERQWTPGEVLDSSVLADVTTVVHLAGAGVGDRRWTPAYKAVIRDSRVLGTDTIARAVAALDPAPVLISASAIGFYGDRGEEVLDENSPGGHGFLADVVRDWEAAAEPARAAGARVVHPRTGLVVSSLGGAWKRMFPLFRFGLGGRLGDGRQWWSFISLRDEVRALRFLMDHPLSGPVNLVAPDPATNAEITAAMSQVLHRPAKLPVPALALRTVLGEFSTEVLSSSRIVPAVLRDAGFTWRDPDIVSAVRAALDEPQDPAG